MYHQELKNMQRKISNCLKLTNAVSIYSMRLLLFFMTIIYLSPTNWKIFQIDFAKKRKTCPSGQCPHNYFWFSQTPAHISRRIPISEGAAPITLKITHANMLRSDLPFLSRCSRLALRDNSKLTRSSCPPAAATDNAVSWLLSVCCSISMAGSNVGLAGEGVGVSGIDDELIYSHGDPSPEWAVIP